MKINRIHAVIGFLLVVVPLVGLGHVLNYAFSMISGAVILFFAMRSIQAEYKKRHRKPNKHDTFVESKPERVLKNRDVQVVEPTIIDKNSSEEVSSTESNS